MTRILLIALLIMFSTACSSLGKVLPGARTESVKQESAPQKLVPGQTRASQMAESCCYDEAEIEAAATLEECLPAVQKVTLTSNCASCSAFVVSAKARKSCGK
jgi:hypothetical protein